jgi:hypothetical protein
MVAFFRLKPRVAGNKEDMKIEVPTNPDGPVLCFSREAQMTRLSDCLDSMSAEATSNWISGRLEGNRPLLVSRFGSTEIRAMWRFLLNERGTLSEKWSAFALKREPPFWSKTLARNLALRSGYYPITRESVQSFVQLMLGTLESIDLLGSWVPGECIFKDYFQNSSVSRLPNLEPFNSDKPWTEALREKRVVVVHPFADTIRSQYSKRDLIFSDKEILPLFTLSVVRAPQTRGGRDASGLSWVENLRMMATEAILTGSEIAIVGCGAYGMPLGKMLKDAGMKVIHLGGATQLLFGIKGRRWDALNIYNENWVSALPHEWPRSQEALGDSPYW